MEDSSMDQTQTAELHILAFYNGFFTLHLFHLPSFSFRVFFTSLYDCMNQDILLKANVSY